MIERLVSRLAAKLIPAVDWIDERLSPFDHFTRPAQPKDHLPLSVKVRQFETELYSDFLIRDETIMNYRIPLPVGSPRDAGDQALWHGIATGTEAVKCYLGDRGCRCSEFLRGLEDQQPGGILIRGIKQDGTWELDASNDQATGHLFGLFGMWQWGPLPLRAAAATLMDRWASRILANGHALINPDGRPTTYGQLIRGWKTDPLRLTLCLAIYAAAQRMVGDVKYGKACYRLLCKYRDLAEFPKVKLWRWDTYYDTHRAAIHLMILSDLIQYDVYSDGLKRLRYLVRKDGNVWVNALCAVGLTRHGLADRDTALKVLSEFTMEDKAFNIGRQNSLRPDIAKFKWGDEWYSRQPLPKHELAAQDFFWQRHPHKIDFRKEGDLADSRYGGLDFCAAYWMSRLAGILNALD